MTFSWLFCLCQALCAVCQAHSAGVRNWSNKIEAISESFFFGKKSPTHRDVHGWSVSMIFFSTAINICIDCTNYPVLDSFERPALKKDPQHAHRLNWVWAILKSGFVPSLWCRYGEISVMSDFPCQWAFRWFWIDFIAVIFLMIFDNFLTDGFGIICVITLDVFFVFWRFNIGFIFENLYLFWSTYLSCFYFRSGFWCFTAPKMPVVFKLLLDKLLPKVAHGDLKTENFFIASGSRDLMGCIARWVSR